MLLCLEVAEMSSAAARFLFGVLFTGVFSDQKCDIILNLGLIKLGVRIKVREAVKRLYQISDVVVAGLVT